MNLELKDLTPEQIEIIKNQIAKFEKENEKPKDVIDYEEGWIVISDKVKQAVDFLNETIRKTYSIGLYRDTQEEAEKLLRKMQIEHRLRQWAKMCKEKVDWSNYEQPKYYPIYDIRSNCICFETIRVDKANNVYFTEQKVFERAIEDIGEQNLIDNYFVEV